MFFIFVYLCTFPPSDPHRKTPAVGFATSAKNAPYFPTKDTYLATRSPVARPLCAFHFPRDSPFVRSREQGAGSRQCVPKAGLNATLDRCADACAIRHSALRRAGTASKLLKLSTRSMVTRIHITYVPLLG